MQPLGSWVARCSGCGFYQSALQPAPGTGIPGLEALRRQNFALLLDRLETRISLSSAHVLEVGCAWGWFLQAARDRGACVHGIEPERANADLCRQQGFAVECGFFPADLQQTGPYDLIVFNDVFEHLPDPAQAIQDVQSLLRPGGLVVLNYPSSDGTLFRLAGLLRRLGRDGAWERLWQKGLPSPHLSYFNPRTMDRLVQRYTRMQPVEHFSLPSVSRQGLADRISPSHRGLAGGVMLAGIWSLSFVLPLLWPDIAVSVYRKPSAP